MKKYRNKLIAVILSITMCLSLTSCVTENTRNDIVKKMQKKNIISKEYKLLDSVANSAAPVPGIHSYDYIFITSEVDKDSINNKNKEEVYDNGVAVIRIFGKNKSGVYPIEYFYNVDIYFDEYEFTDSEGNTTLKNNYYVNSLDWKNTNNYYVRYIKYLFGKTLIMTDKEGNSLFIKSIQDKLSSIASKFMIWQ